MIPTSSNSGVLPPFSGDNPATSIRSPYRSDLPKFAQRFATNQTRAEIFIGFLRLRKKLLLLGIRGLQWCNGSFVETKNMPGDIDVVTMYQPLGSEEKDSINPANYDVFDNSLAKQSYLTDAYYVAISTDYSFIKTVAYWHSLFSHRRETMEWKGFIELKLDGDGSEEESIIDSLKQTFQLQGGQ